LDRLDLVVPWDLIGEDTGSVVETENKKDIMVERHQGDRDKTYSILPAGNLGLDEISNGRLGRIRQLGKMKGRCAVSLSIVFPNDMKER
jgi:hypothetical protein